MIPPIPTHQLHDAFNKFVTEREIPSSLSSDALKIRCAIADFILNSEEGSLEERLLEFVSEVPLDV
jgi:hypothetical protein